MATSYSSGIPIRVVRFTAWTDQSAVRRAPRLLLAGPDGKKYVGVKRVA